ncbi:MAG TPA: acyltransferase family protein, partial [Hyphomicrobiaceae bacterium]
IEEFMPSAIAAALYVGNWAFWYDWITPGPVTHAWTLGVEEQFYLAWPLVIGLAARWKLLGAALAIAIAVILQQGGIAILAGSFLAFALHSGRMSRISPWVGALVLFALLLPSVMRMERAPGIALTGVMSIAVIGALLEPSWLTRVFAPLRPVGRISYGLYLWHVPVAWLLPGSPPLAVALTIVAALGSWLFIERPDSAVRRLRRTSADYYEPRPGSTPAPIPS